MKSVHRFVAPWMVGLCFFCSVFAEASDATRESCRISIWNGNAPLGDGTFENVDVWITVHHPKNPNGAEVIICPGGGYGGLVKEPEGFGIAKWLNHHGIAGIVLEYRLPQGRANVPMLDVQRALRMVRANAMSWAIDPHLIGVMGFSAGGHLASTAATHFDGGNPAAIDVVERVSCRPDFAILVYPVITMGELTHQGSRRNLLGDSPSAMLVELFSNEKQVNATTPPTFLAHAKDDTAVAIENSQMFYKALNSHHIPGQLLELPSGGHGLDSYQGPMWDAWQEGSLVWLESLRISKKR